jgi:hypothetical protein
VLAGIKTEIAIGDKMIHCIVTGDSLGKTVLLGITGLLDFEQPRNITGIKIKIMLFFIARL